MVAAKRFRGASLCTRPDLSARRVPVLRRPRALPEGNTRRSVALRSVLPRLLVLLPALGLSCVFLDSSASLVSLLSIAPATLYPDKHSRAKSSASTDTAAPATAPTEAPRTTPLLVALAATAPATAPMDAPATANAPTNALLNTVVAGFASRVTSLASIAEETSHADWFRAVVRWREACESAKRAVAHIEHTALVCAFTASHETQLHVGGSVDGGAVVVVALIERGLFCAPKPAQQL